MKKMMVAAALLVLSGCAHTTYTEAKRTDGSILKHVAIGLSASNAGTTFRGLKASNHLGF